MLTTLDAIADHLTALGRGRMRAELRQFAGTTLGDLGVREMQESIKLRLRSRSGGMVRSVVSRLSPDADIGVVVDVPVPQAHILDQGGTVRSSRPGGALAIPIGPALKPDGSARFSSPRQVPTELSLIVTRKRTALLIDETGRPWFVLMKSVTIRGRYYRQPALDAWQRRAVPRIEQFVAGLLEGAIAT